jgi:hypothetical protein
LWDTTEEFFFSGIQWKRFFPLGSNEEWHFQILSASHCLQIKILAKSATWTVKPILGKNEKWKIVWLTLGKFFFPVVGYTPAENFLSFKLK